MDKISVMQIVSEFNHSEFHRRTIPVGMAAGWPSVQRLGKMLTITIPYYQQMPAGQKVALYPLYCSVTFPLKHMDRILDFTIYAYQSEWEDLDYTKPVGYFKHEALRDVQTKKEYRELCRQLYAYYDQLVESVSEGRPFEQEEEMAELFSKLMEPSQYPQYLRINRKFYSCFCSIIQKEGENHE